LVQDIVININILIIISDINNLSAVSNYYTMRHLRNALECPGAARTTIGIATPAARLAAAGGPARARREASSI